MQAQIFRIDAATGTTQNVFNVVPNGCVGASVWGSVSVDTSNSTLYFATGNGGSCAQPETNGVAVVELNATNLAFIGSWQVSMTVQSTGGVFVEEHPMYWDTGSSGTQGGSDVIGYMGN